MAKKVLICKCVKKELNTETGGLYETCSCGSPNRKKWDYEQVIIQSE